MRRQRKGRSATELLDPEGESADAFVGIVVSELIEIVEAGRSFAEGLVGDITPVDAAGVAAELGVQVREWVTAPLRSRLERVVAETDGSAIDGSETELADRLRSVYREWRNEKLPELSGDLVTLAFNRGVLDSTPASVGVCWVVDHGGLPCPDAEDNHLAGVIVAGEAFPTGDLCPPAHPGCRCLLVPTRR